jgi:hypothetical protein
MFYRFGNYSLREQRRGSIGHRPIAIDTNGPLGPRCEEDGDGDVFARTLPSGSIHLDYKCKISTDYPLGTMMQYSAAPARPWYLGRRDHGSTPRPAQRRATNKLERNL